MKKPLGPNDENRELTGCGCCGSDEGWIACDEALPDFDTTVMTFAPGSSEPIWPAYHDGEQWMDLNGAPINDAVITHWMDFPEPPEVRL
jgi:Protein of unknown function (DUF551).